MAKYKYHAKCSQCGRGFRSNLKSDLLKRLRKHLWSKHGDWMRRRIKLGLRKAKRKKGDNPGLQPISKILNPKWVGFVERPVIEKMTGRPYGDVKADILDAFANMLMGGLTKE
jgi:hypothetical protein